MEIGYMQGNEFILDGETIVLDETVAQSPGSHTINFKFVGGN